MTAIYVATARATGTGREGHVETTDGKMDLDLALPKELGGSGAGTNPEQLVALGYAACFSSALALTARRRQVTITEVEVCCEVSLNEVDDGDYALAFEIVARLPGVVSADAARLVAETHAVCPYSKAFSRGAPAHARLAD